MIQMLSEEWKQAGVHKGDVLLVHSSIKHLFKRYLKKGIKLTAEDILNSLLDALGPKGTLVLPLFNFDFTKGVPFDVRSTPSHMGALTEAARVHPLAVRTKHPIYSFAAIGYKANEFQSIDNFSGYGDDSPFAMLLKLNAKIAVLGLTEQQSMTFYHHIEEMNNVDYRFHKKFIGNYTNEYGVTEQKAYGLFVRKIDEGVLTHVNPAGELLWQAGLYSGCRPLEGCGLRTILAKDMFQFISNIIAAGKAKDTLYRIEGE